MISPHELLRDLEAAGIKDAVVNGNLRLRGPTTRVHSFANQCRRGKAGLLRLLSSRQTCVLCGAAIVERLLTSWGGKVVHRACGERAFAEAKAAYPAAYRHWLDDDPQ